MHPHRAPAVSRDTGVIGDLAPTGIDESERLARRWFMLAERRSFDELVKLLAEDVVVVSKVEAGTTFEGREQFAQFLRGRVADSLFEVTADVYRPLDDNRVIVEGRMRWMDDERVIRDDPVVWAMTFEDGLLQRFVPARTAIEAEKLLDVSG